MIDRAIGPRFVARSTARLRAYQSGAPDANGQAPERHASLGAGSACRHCLNEVAAGQPYLVLAHRRIPAPQPCAEFGQIFLPAEPCERRHDSGEVSAMFWRLPQLLMRGHGHDDRIVRGSSGQVVDTERLARPGIVHLYLRSAADSCHQCRIERRA